MARTGAILRHELTILLTVSWTLRCAPMLALKFLSAYIFVLDMELEHVVDRASDLVGGRDLGKQGIALGAFTPIEGSKGTRTMASGGSRLAKSLTSPITSGQRSRAQHS